MHLDVRPGDALVGFTQALVTADFGVLPLTLLHECLELGIVGLGDGLGLHLDVELAARALDACSDVDDGLLEQCDTHALVQALAGEDVQRWRDQLDLDLVVGRVARLSAPAIQKTVLVKLFSRGGGSRGGSAQAHCPPLPQSCLDSIDTLVAEAGHLDVGTELGGLRGQPLGDVALELLLDGLAGKLDVLPNIGVGDAELEGVDRVAVFPVEGPGDGLV